MTGMWFVLALIALAGACALLYFDRSRRDQTGRVRQIWAKAQGYTYESVEERLPAKFHRAAMAKQEYLSALDVVRGERRGESFILFDLEETATIVAVHRKVGSDVDIDLRLKSTPPPKDADLELLGAIGPRVVFATDLEIARRVCDQRMVAFTESVPPHVNMLWSEGSGPLVRCPSTAPGANGIRRSRRWPGCPVCCTSSRRSSSHANSTVNLTTRAGHDCAKGAQPRDAQPRGAQPRGRRGAAPAGRWSSSPGAPPLVSG